MKRWNPGWLGLRKISPSKRRQSVEGATLVGTLIGIVILTLVFTGGFMAIENDGTATAVQASQVQATTVGDSILNLEQANPGCGNYTAMGATTTGGSVNLGALSTWTNWNNNMVFGSANGDFSIANGSLTYIGTGASSPEGILLSPIVTVVPGQIWTVSAYVNATNVISAPPYSAAVAVWAPNISVTYALLDQIDGQKGTLSQTFTIPPGVTQIEVAYQTRPLTATAGLPVTWSQIQLTTATTLSGANSQLTPCQVGVPASEYHQAVSDTQQPPASLSSCGSEPEVTTLNLEQASPSPWFCVDYSGQVLWGYTESSWVLPTADTSVCPGSSGESSAVPVARLLKRTVVLKSQVLNQPVRTYTISRTTAPSVGALPAGGASSTGLKSVMITGVPQGDFAELAMNLWTGGTGGASQSQIFVTGAPNSQGQIFFPAIPADATEVEYWITSTPSLQNPPSAASGTPIPSLSNTVTCEAG